MSPSLDQDNSNSPPKLTPKSPAAGLQIPTKGRKNGTAKNSGEGSVLGAVLKKNALKNPDSKTAGTGIPNHFPPSVDSEMKPDNSGNNANGNPGVTSPLLDALSAEASAKSSSQNTSEWLSKSIISSSPNNNLINLGESPPNLPSSYEDRLANFGWNIREQRGIPSSHPASASPPAHRRRPISYHNGESLHQQTEENQSHISSYANRRRSMASPYPQFNANPPLPHQTQPHFYGVDANILLPTRSKLHNGYYSGFDQLLGENVVVSGHEGGLDVFAVTKRGLQRTARVAGLRGGVYNAKILPGKNQKQNLQQSLIAVVVHGPTQISSETSSGEYTIAPTEGISTTQAESARGSPRMRPPSVLEQDSSIETYQTTVEVYSIGGKEHITTLLSLPRSSISHPVTGSQFRLLPPGSLSIRADTNNIVISSGATGETWIFRQEIAENTPTTSVNFKCIGKIWTTVQQGFADSNDLPGQIDGDWNSTDVPSKRQHVKAPILSLNGRWLAYCPSTPSSQVSIRAAVHAFPSTARVPGLNGQAPPQLPPINCEVETPGGESVMKQVAQVITQRMAEGATFIGKQGVQAWNNYWNKPSPNQVSNGMHYQTQGNMAHQFPPTHGALNQAPPVSKDPGLISIIDLDHLAHHSSFSGPPHPLATFKVPHGCSFISFAPSGLALFTASSKGDMQFVWDLMRVQYAKPSFLKGGQQNQERNGPYVRQIAQFSRMTIARIVDVVWTSPHGERAAMVTEPGTVHILDLPASAFTWPPPRKRVVDPKTEDQTPGAALSAAGVASNAVNSLWTVAKPLVSRKRRSSTSMSGISASSVKSQAGQGTQALAAGISRSVGAATGKMNEMRKSGSTKLHLPRSAVTPSRACIKLFNGKRSDSVLVLGGGMVGLYTVKSRRADRPTDKQKASRGAKYVEFRLPAVSEFAFSPDAARELHQADFELADEDIDSHRSKHRPVATGQSAKPRGAESSIPQAEIESNAPYQPFHTDRRVGLHVYSHGAGSVPSPSISALLSPPRKTKGTAPIKPNGAWAFGGPIKTIKLDVGPQQNTEDSFYAPSEHRALPSSAIERVMRVTDVNEDVEQIVVTTRIRKSARSGAENSGDFDEEGFFEDDCEVLDFASQRV